MGSQTAELTEFVMKAQAGDRDAMAAMFDLLQPRIYRFLAVRTPTREVAEDLTQTTFVEMIQSLPRYRVQSGAKFTTWLFQIARFRLIDYYRTQGREVTVETLPDTPNDDMPPDPIMSDLVDRAWRRLPEQYQTVLHLKFREGFSASEIAEVLKTSALNARVLQHRALKALRRQIGNHND